MFEKILVPLDGSTVGEAALPKIEELVGKLRNCMDVEITLMQVVASATHYLVAEGTSVQVPYTEQEMNQIKTQVLEYLEKAGEKLRTLGSKVKTRVAVGNPAEEIIKVSDEIDADLVAMSTHGRSGISRWAFGSVTDRVLRAGSRPVLVVRAPKK